MILENLQQKYLELGGDLEEIENINDESILQQMISFQERINELNENDDTDEPELSLEEKLEQAKQNLIGLDMNSDDYRKAANIVIHLENEIRQELGLPEKPFHVLDEDLKKLLLLDNYELSNNCNEFLDKYSENKVLQQDLKFRLENLISAYRLEKEQQQKRLETLNRLSQQYQKLKKVPVRYKEIENHGKIELIVNPKFKTWTRDIQSLNAQIQKQIKTEQSWEKDPGIDFEKDERTSIYKLNQKVQKLIADHLEE